MCFQVGNNLSYQVQLHGFPSVHGFLVASSDVCNLQWRRGSCFILGVASKETTHVVELVKRQQEKQCRRGGRGGRGGGVRGGRSSNLSLEQRGVSRVDQCVDEKVLHLHVNNNVEPPQSKSSHVNGIAPVQAVQELNLPEGT